MAVPSSASEISKASTEATQPLLGTLARVWGYPSLYPMQERVIASIRAGRETFAIMPTGAGKSLCFQLPVVHDGGLALVISPLIALMRDQVRALTEVGIPAAFINSTLTLDEKRMVRNDMLAGELRLVYVAPETALKSGVPEFFSRCNITYVAVDEVHCISQWGHDFRPEYRALATLRDKLPGVPFHAFTATATRRVQKDVQAQLRFGDNSVIEGSVDRPNLVYRAEERHSAIDQVSDTLERHPGESGIVYAITRGETETLAAGLRRRGFRAAAYHAGLSPEERRRVERLFSDEEIDAIVATVAFGMGIDRSNVRFVIHAGMPKSLEHYQQEAGRAGRDGLPAECLLLYSFADLMKWKAILAHSEVPLNDEIQREQLQKLNRMLDFARGHQCRHRTLVQYFSQKYNEDTCGACDVCGSEILPEGAPLPPSQASIAARKILSAAYRLGNQATTDRLVAILSGADEIPPAERPAKSFASLAGTTPDVIRAWTRQLLGQRYLDLDGDILYPTELGMQLAREGNLSVRLSSATVSVLHPRDGAPIPARKPEPDKRPAKKPRGLVEASLVVKELKAIRREIAARDKIAPFLVMSDRTIMDIAERQPTTAEEYAECFGIGTRKLETLVPLLLTRMATVMGKG